MNEEKMVAYRVLIILAAVLCLIVSIGLFLSGLEASRESFDLLNVKFLLLLEGMLGISGSAFSLTNEVLVSGRKRLFLSTIGASILFSQGLHILEFGIITNGWYIILAFGIPVSALSLLGLIFIHLPYLHVKLASVSE